MNQRPWPIANVQSYPLGFVPVSEGWQTAAREPADFIRPLALTLLLAAHAALGLVFMRFQGLATIHALVALAGGLALGLISRSPRSAVCAAAYAAGAECLWRVTKAAVFWEYGKYAVAAILLVALYRLERPRIHHSAVLYFCLLLPSAVITLSELPMDDARQRLSFNLSGPFLLAVGVLVFSNLRLAVGELHRAFTFFLMPLASVASIAIYGIATAENLRFSNDSNAVTSGGFGPNQVSAVLGLGIFFAVLCMLHERTSLRLRLVLLAALLLFTAQSALTFSRSGLYIAGAAILAALFYLARTPVVRARLLQVLPMMLLLLAIMWPRIDAFTDGALSERFTDVNLTHRDELAYDDWLTFLDSPVFGAGPGMGQAARMGLAAHTEFSRLLAEHGICGLAALTMLALAAWRRWLSAGSHLEKGYVVSLLAWGVLYMMVNGMRLAAPSLACGLAFARFADWRTSR
jgi:O-antigen ligase